MRAQLRELEEQNMSMKMDLKQNERVCASFKIQSEQHEKDTRNFQLVKSSIIKKEEVYNPDVDLYVNDLTDF